jgi:hypothetical protein
MNLAGRYTSVIKRPEDVIFSATYNQVKAAADDACALTSGNIYSRGDLASIKLADVRDLFGSEFADDVSGGLNNVDPEKLAELASTMPRDDAELFDKLATEAGIAPIQVKAASAQGPGQQEALAEAGAQY